METRGCARLLWVTADGMIHDAPAGFGEFVRRALGGVRGDGDLARYAQQNWGWIACTLAPEGAIDLAFDGADVSPAALARVQRLLESRTGPVRLHVAGGTAEPIEVTPADTADAVRRIRGTAAGD